MTIPVSPATTAAAAPTTLHPIGDRGLLLLLSFVAGFVDTAGFIGLSGIFTAHVTGNFVLAGASLARAEAGVWVRLSMFPVFVLAVVAGAALAHRAKRSGRGLRVLLLAEAGGLALLLAGGIAWQDRLASGILAPEVGILGALGVLAMGIQNALMRAEASALPATTVMTGNFTAFVSDLTSLMLDAGNPGAAVAARQRLQRVWPALAGFTAGAALGAIGIVRLGFGTLVLPLVVVGLLAISSRASR